MALRSRPRRVAENAPYHPKVPAKPVKFKEMNIQHSTLNIEHRIKTEFIRSWKFDVQII